MSNGDAMKTTMTAFEAWARQRYANSNSLFKRSICPDAYNNTHVQAEFVAFRAGYEYALISKEAGDGWVLVPDASNMTDEQAEAIASIANCCGGIAYDIYRAMIAAAPQPQNHSEDVRGLAACVTCGQPVEQPEAVEPVSVSEAFAKWQRKEGWKRPDDPGELEAFIAGAEWRASGLLLEKVEPVAEVCMSDSANTAPRKEIICPGIETLPVGAKFYLLSPTASQVLRMAADVCAEKQAKLARLVDDAIDSGDEKWIRLYEAKAETAMSHAEAVIAGDGALITGLKNDLEAAEKGAAILQQARDVLSGMLNLKDYGCGDGSDYQVETHNNKAYANAHLAISAIDAALAQNGKE